MAKLTQTIVLDSLLPDVLNGHGVYPDKGCALGNEVTHLSLQKLKMAFFSLSLLLRCFILNLLKVKSIKNDMLLPLMSMQKISTDLVLCIHNNE